MHFSGVRQPLDTHLNWRRVAKSYRRSTATDTAIAGQIEKTVTSTGVLINLKPNQALKILRYLASATELVNTGQLHVTGMELVYTGANGAAATLPNGFLAYGAGHSVSNLDAGVGALAPPAIMGEQIVGLGMSVNLSVIDDWFEWDSVPGLLLQNVTSFTLLAGFNVINDAAAASSIHVAELCQYEIWEKLWEKLR